MTPWEKEWKNLEKRERRFLEKRMEKRPSLLERKLEEKIPQTLQERLDITFARAFRLVFEKGTGVIEKTYKREEIERDYQVDAFAVSLKKDRKSLRAISKKAGGCGNRNLLLSGVEGIGLGFLGIGLPDIPVFTGMILKSIYEIALRYGFAYETEEERYFILLLIRGALSHGEDLKQCDALVEEYLDSGKLPQDYDSGRAIREAAETLSGELLYMKFLQGVPVAGVLGGAYDAVYLKQILTYAGLKYKKRFLLKQKPEEGTEEKKEREGSKKGNGESVA